MHATQLVSDVFEHICEWTDPASLSVMARTAGVLHEPAIHALWRSLPSLIPLLQCFPTDSWIIEGDTFVSRETYDIRGGTAQLNKLPPLPSRIEVHAYLKTQGLDRRSEVRLPRTTL